MNCNVLSFRTLTTTLLWLAGVIVISVLIHQLALPVLGYFFPALVPAIYDLAVYGAFPSTSYVTFELSSPSVNIVTWDNRCNDGLILVSPFGPAAPNPGPVILNPSGELVWAASGFGIVMNLNIQEYMDEKFLTFWAGDKDGSRGIGSYFMLNTSYDVVREISAITNREAPRKGDMHDFLITQAGTALITIYDTIQYDLSNMRRPKDGWVVDSLFQEINLSTGELLFEWRASDHLKPEDSLYINPLGGYKQSSPYDFFHINSLDKSGKGNYLISSRHFSAIYCLNPLGDILWTLGGTENDFYDLSNGKATSFKWQHDARWIDEEKGILSLYDNENAGVIMRGKSYSQGLVLQIDVRAMTVRCLQDFKSISGALAASQGSMEFLPENEHYFVGWGSSAAFSEFASDGALLCETHITPSVLFWWERVKTYRAIKVFDWIGIPSQPPSAVYAARNVYVSWNGATEIATWQLEGSLEGVGASEWQTLDIHDKQGFEDNFDLDSTMIEFAIYRVAALDKQGEVMMYSNIVRPAIQPNRTMRVLLGVCAILGLVAGVFMSLRSKLFWSKLKLPYWRGHQYTKVQNLEMD